MLKRFCQSNNQIIDSNSKEAMDTIVDELDQLQAIPDCLSTKN